MADSLTRSRLDAAELGRLIRFGSVGVAAFLVDAAVLYAATDIFGISPYGGRGCSYLVAATAAWALNRWFTFPGTMGSPFQEWCRYLAANAGGAMINLGVYAALIASSGILYRNPIIAAGVGAVSGLAINYLAAKHFVFRTDATEK